MNYAIIDSTGLVINMCQWDGVSPWQPPEGCIAVATNEAWIGWTYANGVFTPPPEPEDVPQ